MSKDLVSIIIPIFNSSKYLEECLTSVISQSYSNIEIILVDDGSKDNSVEICRKYVSRDSRVFLYTLEHKGNSAARNYGISASRGTFICFVDSDDCLPQDSIKNRVAFLLNYDLAIFDYQIMNSRGVISERHPSSVENQIWDRSTAIRNMLENSDVGYQGYIWNKIYRAENIKKNNIKFNERFSYNEDRLFNIEYLGSCQYIYYRNIIVYTYRKNENGVMSLYQLKGHVRYQELKSFICINKYLKKLKEQDNIIRLHYILFYKALETLRINKKNKEKNQKEIVSLMKKSLIIVLHSPKELYSLSQKLKMVMHCLVKY